MAVCRESEMTLGQLTAFTLTDDHAAQEHVWFESGSYDRHPRTLRRVLTRTLVEGSDRRALFVGVEAYESAGGTIVRDLFQSEDEGYFTDSQLLDRLAADKLAAEADKIKAEGWGWVEAMTEVDYAYLSQYRRIPPTEVELSKKEEARLSKCCARHDALIEGLEDDAPDEVIAELGRLDVEIERLSRKKEQWSDEDRARPGAVISLDYHGKVCVTRGLAKEEPSNAGARKKAAGKNGKEANDGQSKPNGAVSERLLEDLTAHRTAALRAVLAGEPATALRALAHVLVSRAFFGFTGEPCVDIRARCVDLRPSAEGIGESKAVEALAQRHRALLEHLPEPEKLWMWLVDQSDQSVLELLAYCVAVTVNAVRRKGDGYQQARFDQADMLAGALGLDMADWWEPTDERYLNRVPKGQIVVAVSEAVSSEAAESLRPMKKDAMATKAGELLAGKRWLLEALRPVQASLA